MGKAKLFVALTSALLFTSSLQAAEYPAGPVQVIVPFPAGSQGDLLTRIVNSKMEKLLGKPFIVVNRPGAVGEIAVKAFLQARPDGTTLLNGFDGPLTINMAAHMANARHGLPYNPYKDLVPLGLDAELSFVLLANNDLPANNLQELIAYAKQNPNKLSMAWANPSGQLITHLLLAAGVPVVPVPTQAGGEQQALNNLIAGHVQLAPSTTTSALPQLAAGKVKLIGTIGKEHNTFFPGSKTLGEQGLPVFDRVPVSWSAYFALPGTPPDVLEKLTTAFRSSVKDPEVIERMRVTGNVARYEPPHKMGQRLDDMFVLFRLILEAGIQDQIIGN